ncbi:MAG TPA: hypothetical protein VLF66_10950 [Thermoanaerobaculia bacterium]|nr:hypothetical protein [Thermoanaerobaculia bacterium]
MAENVERLAEKLGAEVKGKVPDYSAGAFGVAALAEGLRQRLEPGAGKRPGRPTNPRWTRRPKVPMAPQTEARLRELADMLSDERRKVSPMQVAAEILERATASYFAAPSHRWGRR